MPQAAEDWPRLAAYVTSARLAAGFKDIRAFAAAAGISERTLAKLERGGRVSAGTLATVAGRVGWAPDSPRAVLAGGEPVTQRASPRAQPERAARSAADLIARPADDAGLFDPQTERDLAPFLAELGTQVWEAQQRAGRPAETLAGPDIFPSPREAWLWDTYAPVFPSAGARIRILAVARSGTRPPAEGYGGNRRTGLTAVTLAYRRRHPPAPPRHPGDSKNQQATPLKSGARAACKRAWRDRAPREGGSSWILCRNRLPRRAGSRPRPTRRGWR